ncbi:MAG TPA: polysaccharide deacetylase family protein [bacterium]|nr:polysaccharide deacetylase family protein [bacterium]
MDNRLKRFLSDPGLKLQRLRGEKGIRHLFKQYSDKSVEAGIDKLYFVLSFDCDIRDDLEVIDTLNSKLNSIGIKPVYAAPGKIIEINSDVFRNVISKGSEIINHGYDNHAYFDESLDRYVSTFFYDKLSYEEVRQDIIRGDETIKNLLGISPSGFRAPHFSTFQGPRQLECIYTTLIELGYKYSTTTMPVTGLKNGAAFRRNEITEFPVSGMWSNPFAILDSWNFFKAPDRIYAAEDYFDEGNAIASYFSEYNLSGVLNYYADPSHVIDNDIFFGTVEKWAGIARNVTYSELMKEIQT